MKKLNSGYFEFFFFRYGVIIIFALLVLISILVFSKDEKDYMLLFCLVIMPFLFFVPVSLLDYRSLKKNINPATVFLNNDGLMINEVSYSFEQIKEITLMPVSNTLDKFSINYIEIKINDGSVFYFIDKRTNWKFESPTIRLLKTHSALALKTKEKTASSAGLKAFEKQK